MCSGVPLTAWIGPGSTHLVAPSGWPWANYIPNLFIGFPGGTSGKEPACQCRRLKRHGFNPRIRKIPWRRPWQPTPVFLPGEFHGQRNLAGYSPWGHKESDTTDQTHTKVQSLFKIVEDQNFISFTNIYHFLLFYTVSLENLQYCV